MIDHASISVADYQKGKEFYTALLAPLGYTVGMDLPDYKACGFAQDGARDFWIGEAAVVQPAHIAFVAKNEDAIKAFHTAGLAAGGSDNGAPGPRPEYSPGYWAAFIKDPWGNNIEAVVRNH